METVTRINEEYPEFREGLNFPVVRFEEIPFSVLKQRVISKSLDHEPAFHVALAFSSNDSDLVSRVNEIGFMNKLAHFEDPLFTLADIDMLPTFIQTYDMILAEMKVNENFLMISTVFLFVSSKDDVVTFLKDISPFEKKLNAVTRLVVILRQEEFNSVFLFEWKLKKNLWKEILQNVIRYLWVDGRLTSFKQFLDKYHGKGYFVQAFIQLMPPNENLFDKWSTYNKVLWGRHLKPDVRNRRTKFEALLDAQPLKDITLCSDGKNNLRSLFVKGPIKFKKESKIFEVLSHLNWTITNNTNASHFTAMTKFFPDLLSLTLTIHKGVKIRFSLHGLPLLEELEINDCPEDSGIVFTHGRPFVQLKSLILTNFKGKIYENSTKYRDLCDIHRLFIRKLILSKSDYAKVKCLVSRSFKTQCEAWEHNSLSSTEQQVLFDEYMRVKSEKSITEITHLELPLDDSSDEAQIDISNQQEPSQAVISKPPVNRRKDVNSVKAELENDDCCCCCCCCTA